jgi:oligoendopeptidase F
LSIQTRALSGTLCAFLTVWVVAKGIAQEKFVPIPPDIIKKYHFNYPRNFFASPEVERAGRKKVDALLTQLEKYKGKVTSSPSNLYDALELSDRAQSVAIKHAIYLYLRYAANTKDTDSNEASSKVFADLNTRSSFLQQELMRFDRNKEIAYARKVPALKKYAFVIESSRRLAPHTLSLKEEELLSAIAPMTNDWPGELYQKAIDTTKWAVIKTPSGDLDVRKDEGAWRNSNDRSVREEGFKKYYQGTAADRDIYAFALIKTVKSRNQLSQLRHYKDFPAESHFGIYLTTPQVKGLFERLAQQGSFNKRYQQLRADHIKKVAGYESVNVWDMTVVPKGVQRPQFNIGQSNEILLKALAPFGSEWNKELAGLLDPNNGRLDIAPGDNRVPGAFAWGFPGSQISIFYSYNYEGFYNDLSTLAHESGHAVHFQLMANNKVLPSYTGGPIFFTESFAMFNELLVPDYLYQKETDHFRKTYFLEQFLNQAMGTFAVTRQAAIEQGAYDGVATGKVKNADDLDAMAKRIGSRYSMWFEKHDDLKMEWIDVHHFYTQPMYYVNYVFANFLALKYYEMYQRDPKGFIPKYLALVRNGFDDAPEQLLKKYLGISLQDPKLVSDAFAVVDSKIKALEGLYASE